MCMVDTLIDMVDTLPFFIGKTFLLQDLIRRLHVFVPNAHGTKVVYCYNSVPPNLGTKNYVAFRGLPDIAEVLSLASRYDHTLFVLDDILQSIFMSFLFGEKNPSKKTQKI